ncbi:phage tail protein [Terrabacter sp. Root181]|uniref:phage tail protein n=1 Tax=Terrabacter sp. Root181 TaxID=1736484 RepID=UPI0006F89649|nr:phage tail protein [Terrabacter sp. Root181]KRB43013.1 hypothetical protein ASD90_21740 [Terrabacter sp. Root181]
MATASSAQVGGRRMVPLAGPNAWFLPQGCGAVLEPVAAEVLLAGEPIGPQAPWPDGGQLPPERAGLCFDGCGSLYHGDPDSGQVVRLPWPPTGHEQPSQRVPWPADADPGAAAEFVPTTGGGRSLRTRALAIDAHGCLYVLDGASETIAIIDPADDRLIRTVATAPGPPRDIASAGDGVIAALASRSTPIVWLDEISGPRRFPLFPAAVPELAALDEAALPSRVAIDPAGGVWLLLRAETAAWIVCCTGEATGASLRLDGACDLEFDATGRLIVGGPAGSDLLAFTVDKGQLVPAVPLAGQRYDGRGLARAPDGRVACWTDRGARIARPYRLRYPPHGFAESYALDSLTPRAVWGRIFIEACVPPGARLDIGFATLDELPHLAEPDAGLARPVAGPPAAPASLDELDVRRPLHRRETGRELPWTPLSRGDRYEVYEAPVIAPPGRYLFVRFHLSGTPTQTPRVRAARVECDSHALMSQLPRIYREDPSAEQPLRRYLAIVDGLLRDLEWRALERHRVLDPWGAPAELLPWLGSLIGLSVDERWSEQARRTLLAEAMSLFRARGTVRGLTRLLEIYLGAPVSILEAFRVRGYGGAFVGGANDAPGPASAVVGETYRVGGALGGGDDCTSADDAFTTHAHRFTVLVARDLCADEVDVVQSILDVHRPAHTVVEVCTAAKGMRVGISLHIELSTVVGPGAAFGSLVVGGAALESGAVLGRGRAGVRLGTTVLEEGTVIDP